MKDNQLYQLWLTRVSGEAAAKKEGRFITKDGKVIFIGGPGGGTGGMSGGSTASTQTTITSDYATRTRDEQLQQIEAALALHNRYVSEDFTENDVTAYNEANTMVFNDLLRLQTETQEAMNNYARTHQIGFPIFGSPQREAIYLPLTRVQQVYDTLRTGRIDRSEEIK